MNSMKALCLLACLLAVASAKSRHRSDSENNNNSKPSEWLSISEVESIPSLDQLDVESLEKMSLNEGAKLVDKLYHLSLVNQALTPNYQPNPSNIPAYIIKSNGQNTTATLANLASKAKQQQNFGDEEVIIFITGLPTSSPAVAKATRSLVKAFKQRYNTESQQVEGNWINQGNKGRTSSEESSEQEQNSQDSGDLIVIKLGAALPNLEKWMMLDIEQTGAIVANALLDLTNEAEVPHEIIHIVAQGVGAHVAGAAARQYTRLTGHKLRRITALDPSKIFARKPNVLNGLARGDAEFIDGIHTSVYGIGTTNRVGNADYFPNGPSVGVPGAENVVEASMRATRYFAESMIPGNEKNFPAVAARSLQEYRNKNGYGKRTHMGIDTDYDVEGDYILEVNPSSPFGKQTPAQKQNRRN